MKNVEAELLIFCTWTYFTPEGQSAAGARAISIRDLRTFLAIAEMGSFAAAARVVRRTQSAVSMQMRALETELGVTLFDRTRRPPALNDNGRAFIAKATAAVEAYERLFEARAGSEAIEGHLRLGAVPSVITGMMPPALAALRRKYPGLHIALSMGLSADLVERVRRGKLDAAIVSELRDPGTGLKWAPYAREPLVLIAPGNAPDLAAEELIARYPFIRYSRQAWVGQLIDQVLEQRRLKVNETMALDTLEAVAAMVAAGLGVSIVPARSVGPPLPPAVRQVPLRGRLVHRDIGLLSREAPSKAVLIDALLGELKSLVESAPAGGASARPRRKTKRGTPASLKKR
jgi:DNA-binding transcriptional LysR family regulator